MITSNGTARSVESRGGFNMAIAGPSRHHPAPKMLIALLAATVPVLLGTTLALFPQLLPPAGVRAARLLAIVAGLAVVFFELLPEAWHEAGLWSVPIFALGLGLPWLGGRLLGSRKGEHSLAGEELAFVAIGLHQVVDGLEIGAAWFTADAALVLTLAIAAHSIPLLGAVLLELGRHRGRWDTVVRGGLLVLATGIGAVLGWSGSDALPGAHAWLPALLAGLFLHVLWHLRHDDSAHDH
jgi:hypothetical protein